MIFPAQEVKLKDGRKAVLRSAEPRDAAALLDYLKETASETKFLLREPEEITYTLAQEEQFIQHMLASERELLLVAVVEHKLAGTCSLSSVGAMERYAHRCGAAIALYREYWGIGLGKRMLRLLLDTAAKLGYEQAELEVVEGNERALQLYESMGFQAYGKRGRGLKYRDGTYADEIMMVKTL